MVFSPIFQYSSPQPSHHPRSFGIAKDPDPPAFSRIDAVDLARDDRLSRLYLEAVRQGWWPNSNRMALEFFALAEKALADDTHGTPGKLFHALVKARRTETITGAQEQRAMQRLPSPARHELVDLAAGTGTPILADPNADVMTLDGMEHLGFSHSVLVQCFFPQRRQAEREHKQHHGNVSLVVRAGYRLDPAKPGALTPGALPWGSRARLILHYITSEAVRTKQPEIDMGHSLRRFLERINVPIGGANAKAVIEQVHDVAGADIILGGWDKHRAVQRRATIAKALSFWMIGEDERQSGLWTPSMTLSAEFFDAINEHPVPLDTRHIAKLGRSARRIDLYTWLSYRTARIRKGGRVLIPIEALRPIFAPQLSDENARKFKATLRRDLVAIRELHPFAAEVDGDALVLRRSSPPIPFKPSVSLPPPKP